MDREQSYSALDFVNKERVDLIADTLFKYGDEHLSKKIAKEIIKNRPIKTTTQLAEICQLAYKKGYYKTHPATKTFQAIRIYVNNELEQLEESLAYASRLLNPGGRLGIITFHSIEDRIVKNFFKFNSNTLDSDYITDNSGGLQNHKKFVTLKLVSEDLNPRARSAKLRVLRVKK
jgi:16S rRNA (cytosine1402-N4)-methyltransferase